MSPTLVRSGLLSLRGQPQLRQFLKHSLTDSSSLHKTVAPYSLDIRVAGCLLQKENTRCFGSMAVSRRFGGPSLIRLDPKPKAQTSLNQVVRGAATKRKEVVQRTAETQPSTLTTGEKVKQAGKDATYTGIVLLGVGVTGIMFFAIGRELLSGESPNGVYTRAFKKCKKNEEVVDAIGEPMKGYGEMTRRGRRRHTNHTEFEVDGEHIMRMKFYIEGPLNKGTAQLEVRKREGQKYEFRYLFVTIDAYPHNTIIIEDNR